jgi:hypothetical protein
MSDDDWTWELASKARNDLAALDPHEQDRILDKLDEIVDSPWRDPPEYGEPLRNSPRKKVRVGEFRLGDVPTKRTANGGCPNQAPWWCVHRRR